MCWALLFRQVLVCMSYVAVAVHAGVERCIMDRTAIDGLCCIGRLCGYGRCTRDRNCYAWVVLQWPFVRVLGVQEPASVVFSVLNALSHVYMLLRLRRAVPAHAPFYWLWHSYAAVSTPYCSIYYYVSLWGADIGFMCLSFCLSDCPSVRKIVIIKTIESVFTKIDTLW